MNTENHEIPENSPVLLRFTVQVPASQGNRAAMATLQALALGLKWEGQEPYVVIKQERVQVTSLYAEMDEAPEPEPVEWHNPDNLTSEQVGEGFRLLAVGESVQEGSEVYRHHLSEKWGPALRIAGLPPAESFTYRTNLPYHPAK